MELRGHLDLLLLAALRRVEPAHGYALIAALRDGSDGVFDMPEGTIYPALRRLETAGLVASAWDDTTGRKRRVYQLTQEGLEALATKRREWLDLAAAVQAVLQIPQLGKA